MEDIADFSDRKDLLPKAMRPKDFCELENAY